MTLTKHGHHIPGTSHDNEDPQAAKYRCGGCQMCQDCYWEWRKSKKLVQLKEEVIIPGMRMESSANGSGNLTATILKSLLEDVPDEAVLTINTSRGDQRDGPYWSLKASWGEDRSTTKNGTKIRNFVGPNNSTSQFGDH